MEIGIIINIVIWSGNFFGSTYHSIHAPKGHKSGWISAALSSAMVLMLLIYYNI